MIKNGFIVSFIIFIGFALFYQKKYLQDLKAQSSVPEQLNDGSIKAIIGQGLDFKTFFYSSYGTLKASLSGQKIVYYEDNTFFAEGNLVYETFNTNTQPTAMIQTNSAIGEFEVLQAKNTVLFSGDRQLKWLKLQQNVSFNFNGNQGTTKNVFIDALKRTISSDEHMESTGPDGTISTNGFFYDIDKKEFKLNSNVKGTYKPPKQDRK